MGEVYETVQKIERESDLLPKYFPQDIGNLPEMSSDAPGFIPYILDFSHILTFAISADGAPFCFDYREHDYLPSIIWWDDVYWRRVAPTFGELISLFVLDVHAHEVYLSTTI